MYARSFKRSWYPANGALVGFGVLVLLWCLLDMPGTPYPAQYRASDIVLVGSILFIILASIEWQHRCSINAGDQENVFLRRWTLIGLLLSFVAIAVGIFFTSFPLIP